MRDESAPAPVDEHREAMRRHLDLLNRQFLRVSTGLQQIDDGLREIIFDHLDAIGLDDITSNRNKEQLQ